jgi:hypothetical protein
MESAGCPVLPQTINLTRSQAAARRAQMIRNRYTVLDLAWDRGLRGRSEQAGGFGNLFTVEGASAEQISGVLNQIFKCRKF